MMVTRKPGRYWWPASQAGSGDAVELGEASRQGAICRAGGGFGEVPVVGEHKW